MLQVSSLIFVIAGYRACFRKQLVPDDYCWIQFIQRQFLNDFKGFKVFHKETLLLMELPIAYERRSISGRRNFSGGEKRQPSFFNHVAASASKRRDEANPVFWLAMRAVLTYATYKATKTEKLPEASESRSSGKSFRQIITLHMTVYRSDLDLRSQISPLY